MTPAAEALKLIVDSLSDEEKARVRATFRRRRQLRKSTSFLRQGEFQFEQTCQKCGKVYYARQPEDAQIKRCPKCMFDAAVAAGRMIAEASNKAMEL